MKWKSKGLPCVARESLLRATGRLSRYIRLFRHDGLDAFEDWCSLRRVSPRKHQSTIILTVLSHPEMGGCRLETAHSFPWEQHVLVCFCLFVFPKEKRTQWTLSFLIHLCWERRHGTQKPPQNLRPPCLLFSQRSALTSLVRRQDRDSHGQLTLRRLLVDQIVARGEAILGHCHVRVEGQGEDPCGRAEFGGGFGPAVLANQRAN